MEKKILFLFTLLYLKISFAQTFEAGIQIRPRSEFRNGFKTLLPEEADPVFFISQRSRINLNYKNEELVLRVAVQNVHIWGGIPTIAFSERKGVKFFEAYAEYSINHFISFRAGRQQLAYDNQRILGGLDWAQQGQSHDVLLLSLLPATNKKLDIGLAVNAEAENLLEVPYTVNSYRNMQFAWYGFNYRYGGLSFLLMNNGYEYGHEMPTGADIQYLQTFGSFLRFASVNFSGDLAAYGQTGQRDGRKVQAFYLGGNVVYNLSGSWQTGVGTEYLSGTDSLGPSGTSRSFSPLFGTNHAFNGLMDYFYVGNHLNSVGLLDVYGKVSYTRQKLEVAAIPHFFWTAAAHPLTNDEEKYLGTEIDFTGRYWLQKDILLSFGYSQMFGTRYLEFLKGGDRHRMQNWAWLMVSFQPSLFSTNRTSAP